MLRYIIILSLVTFAFLTFPSFETRIEIEHNTKQTAERHFKFQNIPPPGKDDAAARAKLTLVDGVIDEGSGELSALTDGLLPANEDDPGANLFFAAGSMGGRFRMDFGGPINIAQVVSYSWHASSRGPQLYKLYAAEGGDANLNLAPKRGVDPATCGWKFIATISTIPGEGDDGGQYAARVTGSGGSLGKYRFLLFDCYVTELNDDWGNTFYSEIDVIEKE